MGSTARSRIRYVRVMGMKEDTARTIGARLGSLVPGPFGDINQRILGRSIAAEIALHSREAGEIILENAAMKELAVQLVSQVAGAGD